MQNLPAIGEEPRDRPIFQLSTLETSKSRTYPLILVAIVTTETRSDRFVKLKRWCFSRDAKSLHRRLYYVRDTEDWETTRAGRFLASCPTTSHDRVTSHDRYRQIPAGFPRSRTHALNFTRSDGSLITENPSAIFGRASRSG